MIIIIAVTVSAKIEQLCPEAILETGTESIIFPFHIQHIMREFEEVKKRRKI